MAKRVKIGSVTKPKKDPQTGKIPIDPRTGRTKADYINVSPYEVKALKQILSKLGPDEGFTVGLESKEDQLASLDIAMQNGKLTEEYVEKQKTFAEKIPDFVRFELIFLDKN